LKKLGALLILAMIGIFCYTSSGLPTISDPKSPPSQHVSPRYIEKSKIETGSPNFVTAVLADYRGYDTLGETTVIFVAGAATVMILRAGKGKGGEGK